MEICHLELPPHCRAGTTVIKHVCIVLNIILAELIQMTYTGHSAALQIFQWLSKSICVLLSNVLLLCQVTWTLINWMSSVGSVDFMGSPKTQARHYKTLQEMFKSKKPNKAAITQLLNLEFESWRFITSKVLKEQDRPTKILEAYPCFWELDHVSHVGPIQSTFSALPRTYFSMT